MTFKTILWLARRLPYFALAQRQKEAIQEKDYKLAHIYNCCMWFHFFKSREGSEKIQARKYVMASYRRYKTPR